MRKLLHLFFLNLAMLLCSHALHAQETVVKGRVTGDNNKPVSGATVTVKGTARSVSTTTDGNYSIRATVGNTLVISSVGYQPQEVRVQGGSADVQLLTDSKSMDNVVVTTALGIQKSKRSLGYSTQ